ncbi:MAG: hypothetical protein PUI99_07750 [Clostridiales bacterium]|nr:hypothetical protein [Clostridiales bacterium]
MENYSLSDIRAATEHERDEGFGGGAWWIIILFLFMFGMGGFGGFGGQNGALTRAEMQQGFDTAEVTRKLDGLSYGLSDGFYAQNTTMLNGFAGVTAAVENARFAAQQCCCETNRNIDGVRYDAQKNTCDIITAIHAEGEATRNLMQQNEIQQLRDRIQRAELRDAMCGVVRYPMATTYTSGGNPFCGCGCCGQNV